MRARSPGTHAARPSLDRSAESRLRPRRIAPRRIALTLAAVATLLAAAVCSRETKHRILVFLYDGVPPLDAALVDSQAEIPDESAASEIADTPEGGARKKRFYSHPLYWKNRCGSCHAANGKLLETVREGLCQSCHFEKPEDKKKYIHGPVAVNGCLSCHRYHKSKYPKILLADAQTLCSRCHEASSLTTDKHHATMETERCIDCHDPHGGDDRFYLLPGAKTTGPS